MHHNTCTELSTLSFCLVTKFIHCSQHLTCTDNGSNCRDKQVNSCLDLNHAYMTGYGLKGSKLLSDSIIDVGHLMLRESISQVR